MSVGTNSFIQLNRTFYELKPDDSISGNDDSSEVYNALGFGADDPIVWTNLLAKRRVVLLASAGSGKTRELDHVANDLRAKGKAAFFLRLEHVTNGLKSALEVGTPTEFEDWLGSDEEGWIFLDSVDESRLKSSTDFEAAIRLLSVELSSALQRLHIYITSRKAAWRRVTDLTLCENKLPYSAARVSRKSSDVEDDIFIDDQLAIKEPELEESSGENYNIPFDVYSLNGLVREQIETFVRARGINDPNAFMEDLTRQEAWLYTTRPQDLEELVEFWHEHGQVGSHWELMSNSVTRRLVERSQVHADAHPLSAEKALEGVKRFAAACTLIQESTISVPDGSDTAPGIKANAVLVDWDDRECTTLLQRPIFDPARYGTVRLDRKFREFLTAQWLFDHIDNDRSRRRVEALLFKEQYGIHVILPSMKGVLNWLVLLDERIRNRALEIEPDIIFCCCDPSKLPMEIRRDVLFELCRNTSPTFYSRSITDYDSIQRFANSDIGNDINALLSDYKDNKEVIAFLLRMVWTGSIEVALPEVKRLAINSRKKHKIVHILAIRALREVGSDQDYRDVLDLFLEKNKKLNHGILAELVGGLTPSIESVEWLLVALKKVGKKKKYSSSGINTVLVKFAKRLEHNQVAKIIQGISKLLNKGAVVNPGYCEVSKKYGWLLNSGIQMVEMLARARHPATLHSSTLQLLAKMTNFRQFQSYELHYDSKDIDVLVRGWDELNHGLFWSDIKLSRKAKKRRDGERLTSWWQAGAYHHYWDFEERHIETIAKDVREKKGLDNRLVALSLALSHFDKYGRSDHCMDQLKKSVLEDVELSKRLQLYLNPPPESKSEKRAKKREAELEKKRGEREAKTAANREEWRDKLIEDQNILCDNKHNKKGKVIRYQSYLHDRMRESEKNSSHWSAGNWQDLISYFGEDVATAYRDGAVKFWKNYKVTLNSEASEGGVNTHSLILGLTGLKILSMEVPNWVDSLSENDANLACRYAIREMNGFPDWLPILHEKFPVLINSILLGEVRWELETATVSQSAHYVLSKIQWDAKWLWDSIYSDLLKLTSKEPLNVGHLSQLLNILAGCSVAPNATLASRASRKCKTLKSHDHLSHWYSLWIGVDPGLAIKELEYTLAKISDQKKAREFAMKVLVGLMGGRQTRTESREEFKTPKYLKKLYLFMNEYIKVEDDVVRKSGRSYSPGIEDDAKNAREGLLYALRDISGKEAFLALVELSKTHRVETLRPWIDMEARHHAERNAESSPWASTQFVEFNHSLESTPTNHRELFDLAVHRLLDLKFDLEEGDTSNAQLLISSGVEVEHRNYIADWMRVRAHGRYTVAQEDELADKKRPDIRFQSSGFDGPVPVELKLACNGSWSGPKLFERLESQLSGDYLRDDHSTRGIFALVNRTEQKRWRNPNNYHLVNFTELVEALQDHWDALSSQYPRIDDVRVIGIDLTKRISKPTGKEKSVNEVI